MRKIINLFCASLFLLVGCTEDVALEVNPISDPFYALVEGTTRTYADENGKLLWTANDKISIFKGNTLPLVYQFTGFTGATYGGFKDVTPLLGDFVTSADLPANYAIYPYVESTTISNSSVIHYTIPSTQAYAENSFGLGANVMVAVTENKDDRNLAFKNVGGYFEFSLYGEGVTVKRIVFSGNNSEKLAGDVTITATHDGTPTVAFADDATTTLTLDCGEGVALSEDENNPTKFWFVVPAMTYTKGITLTITDTDGRIMKKTTSKSITIKRSTVQPLSTVDAEMAYIAPRNNEIWYTSTDGEVVEPYDENGFGANIVSNVYENGRGIITFDGAVTSIGYTAFFGCRSLTSIVLPNGVTSIGAFAFQTCSSLESITIPSGVTTIGSSAFIRCSSLESITLPDSVTSIGAFAFHFCSLLENITIPDSVTSIENGTFYGCRSLESITIPDSVISIGASAFEACLSLESVTIPDSVTSIGDGAFNICSSLTAFYGKYASADNRCLIVDGRLIGFAPAGLTSYSIPSGVTSIGYGAFSECDSLESITIPDGVTSIGRYAFYMCYSLESVTIPDGVISIGYMAFHFCSLLENITIPDSVTSIGDSAFSDCSSLTAFYGKYASADNRCLIVDGRLIGFAPVGLTSYTIPDGVTSIGIDTFRKCYLLENITIPDGVASIDSLAFYYCSSLERITIPSSVTTIGSGAFDSCSSLTTVYSKQTTPSTIYDSIFEYCTNLNKIYVPTESVDAYKSATGWSNYASIIEGYTF